MTKPTYLGEIIDLEFRSLLKTPLLENNHHVTYIDEYVNVVCERFKIAFEENRNLNDMVVKITGDDFAHIPNKFFTDCNIVIKYSYDTSNMYYGGYNINTVVVDEDEQTKNKEDLPWSQRKFNNIYFEIEIFLRGNSINKMLDYLASTLGHEITHALQHIRMKMNHDESFTDEDYLKSYKNIVIDAASEDDIDILKGRFASFLYYTDVNERKANLSEFYNEIGHVSEDDISSRQSILDILEKTKLWEIISVMGKRLSEYNRLTDEPTKQKLISYYNEYFPKKPITKYREFRRIMNGRWNNFYGSIVPKLVNMIREKARKNQRIVDYGPTKPMKVK